MAPRTETSLNVLTTEIICGDCREVLQRFGDGTFDLIVTSPPYADQRARTYGGIKPQHYVEWFLEKVLATV